MIASKERHPFMKWSTVFTLIAGIYTSAAGIYMFFLSVWDITTAFEPHSFDQISAVVISLIVTLLGVTMFKLATWSLKVSDTFEKFSQLSDRQQLLAYIGMIPGMFTAIVLIVVIIVLFDNRRD